MIFTEIFKLKRMLKKAKIPFIFYERDFIKLLSYEVKRILPKMNKGYQLLINNELSAIQNDFSYGNKDNKIEIMGGLKEDELTEFDEVLGNLTAKEVFERFKYCYQNKTSIYKDGNI